jgi:arylsulfatase A-like enzyme
MLEHQAHKSHRTRSQNARGYQLLRAVSGWFSGRLSCLCILLVALVCFPAAGVAQSKSQQRPNILIINIDDMGYGDMSCHGNPKLTTPNIDILYSESIRFPQFHSAPMCTPTRGQLLTGIDALRNGARWVGTENTHMRTDLPTMPEIFRAAGYRTGMFGKWHTGSNYPMRPQDRGFQEVVWFPQQEVGTVNDYFTNDYFDDVYEHNGKREQYKGFCTDVWFNEAMEWMTDRNQAGEPFLCYIPTNVVHGPYFVADEYRERIGFEIAAKEFETFFGMIVNLDDNLGRLDEFLVKQGLKDNTIVIFMTDNGGTAGYNTYNAGMKGLKTQLWEGGHRVPCFIRWPGGGLRVPGDVQGLVQAQDLLPTLLDLCGVPPIENAEFDGQSIAKQLKGEAELPDRVLVVQFQRRIEIKKWDACIMWGPWRLLNQFDIDPKLKDPEKRKELQERQRKYEIKLELYNVEEDPHQDHNVYDEYPEVVSKMKAYYEQWWAKTQPDLDIPRPIIIGNNAENPSYLSATSWAESYFTQKSQIMDGQKVNGFWNLHVDQDGDYEIALRRWPKEARTPIAGATSLTYTDPYAYGEKKQGKALPITSARLQISGFDEKIPVAASDEKVVFHVPLKKGDTRMQTWFYDQDGNMLCGAYYVYVTRK